MDKNIFSSLLILGLYAAAIAAFAVALTRNEIIESGVFFIVGLLWVIIAILSENKYNKIKRTLVIMKIQRIEHEDDKVCIKILDDLKNELCGVVDDKNVKNYIENRIDGLILRIK